MQLLRTLHSSLRTNYKCSSAIRGLRSRSMSRTERDSATNRITIHPQEGSHSATVILMHGLGDSADGFGDVAEMWSKSMPWVKLILPTAQARPVTLNGGMRMNAWYDIVGLDARSAEACEGIEGSISIVREILEAEVQAGILPGRIVLAGFSQGGALALFTGLQLPVEYKPAGIIVMSGYLPAASKFKLTESFQDVPVLHCHGTADMVVRHEWGAQTKEAVVAQGLQNYELKSVPGMPHSVNMDVLGAVNEFLSRIIPNSPELAIKPKAPSEMSVKELKAAIRNAGLTRDAVGFSEKYEYVQLLEKHYASKGL